MTDHEKEILERFMDFVKKADKETQEKMLFFCEGAVSMGLAMKEKEAKTA